MSTSVAHPALERLSRPEIEALQLRRLKRQLERLQATNRFFADRWRQARVDPPRYARLDDLRRLPVVTKEEVLADQVAVPPYGDRLGVDPGMCSS